MARSTSLKVVMKLDSGKDEIPKRIIRLNEGSTLQVGRSSKTERKHLMPLENNCWIKNPVISRNHAVLSHSMKGEHAHTLYIEDLNSSHGTHVNGLNIRGMGKKELRSGDKIRFGDEVQRADVKYDPPVFAIDISSHLEDPRPEPSLSKPHGRTYIFPDNFSDEDDDEYSDSYSQEDDYDSKLSVPGSNADNPLAIDEDDGPVTPIIVEIPNVSRLLTGPPTEYEPSPQIVVIQDTCASDDDDEDGKEADPAGLEGDDIDYDPSTHISAAGNDSLSYSALSPVYTPTSPKWQSPCQLEYIPVNLQDSRVIDQPSVFDIPTPSPPSMYGYQPHSGYADGPFAQHSLEHVAKESQDEHAYSLEHFRQPPSIAEAERRSELSMSGLTVTTNELINTSRLPTLKNDMAIENLINPPQVHNVARTGAKRKAVEISEDQSMPSQSNIPSSLSKSSITPPPNDHEAFQDDIVIQSQNPVTVHTSAVTEERPRKRLLRDFGVLAIGSALGGLGVLAGLVALPDSVFQ